MSQTYYTMEPQQFFQGSNYSLWQPQASTNTKIQVDAGITSNWKYRQYMQQNANQIMKYNTMETIKASGNNPYSVLNTNVTNNAPYLYSNIHDTNNPLYGFRNSDLKQDYMKKEQMNARKVAPSIPIQPKF
jgi:hypothetical protein